MAGSSLRNGASLSCGKCRETAHNLIDETGHRYGRLTVIGPAGMSNDKHKKWLCQCDCGKQIIAIGKNLRSGGTTSCGCYREERRTQHNQLDITGKKFGKLTAIKSIGKDSDNQFVWECKCECGNTTYKTVHSLMTGNVKSCGCVKSRGEVKIEELLNELNINFKREYSFDDLLGANGGKLRFDFAILDNENQPFCFIEFQGIQHYDINNNYYSEDLATHDLRKKEYCKEHNFKLVEIKFTEYDKLDSNFLKEKIYGTIY